MVKLSTYKIHVTHIKYISMFKAILATQKNEGKPESATSIRIFGIRKSNVYVHKLEGFSAILVLKTVIAGRSFLHV